jgi:hypothetical protein
MVRYCGRRAPAISTRTRTGTSKKDAGSIWMALIFGSPVAVPASVDAKAGADVSGPAGYLPGDGSMGLTATLKSLGAAAQSVATDGVAAIALRADVLKQEPPSAK